MKLLSDAHVVRHSVSALNVKTLFPHGIDLVSVSGSVQSSVIFSKKTLTCT